MSLAIQRLSYKRIGDISDKFLKKYHPSLSLPIPIEEIAEQKLGLTILQEMDLKKNYDVDGFLTSDLKTIFLDFNMYLKYENRTRFTIQISFYLGIPERFFHYIERRNRTF